MYTSKNSYKIYGVSKDSRFIYFGTQDDISCLRVFDTQTSDLTSYELADGGYSYLYWDQVWGDYLILAISSHFVIIKMGDSFDPVFINNRAYGGSTSTELKGFGAHGPVFSSSHVHGDESYFLFEFNCSAGSVVEKDQGCNKYGYTEDDVTITVDHSFKQANSYNSYSKNPSVLNSYSIRQGNLTKYYQSHLVGYDIKGSRLFFLDEEELVVVDLETDGEICRIELPYRMSYHEYDFRSFRRLTSSVYVVQHGIKISLVNIDSCSVTNIPLDGMVLNYHIVPDKHLFISLASFGWEKISVDGIRDLAFKTATHHWQSNELRMSGIHE